MAAVGSPGSLVMFTETDGQSSFVIGRDDSLRGGPWDSTRASYVNARSRHNNGSNYTFADGHSKWFKAPDTAGAPTNTTFRSESVNGVCWQSPKRHSRWQKCVGWFYSVDD